MNVWAMVARTTLARATEQTDEPRRVEAKHANFTMSLRSRSPLCWTSTPRPSIHQNRSEFGTIRSQDHDPHHTPRCRCPSMYHILRTSSCQHNKNLHTCRLEQHCMSRPQRRIFPALALIRGRHGPGFATMLVARCNRRRVRAGDRSSFSGWTLEIVEFFGRTSSRPPSGRRLGSSSPTPRPLALFKESRRPPTSALNDDRWTRFPHSNLCLTRRSRTLRRRMTRPRPSGPTRLV